MSVVVVDASVAIKCVTHENLQPQAASLLAGWNVDGVLIIVPSWFSCEVTNVLFQQVRQGDITLGGAKLALNTILSNVLIRDIESDIAVRGLEIAASLSLRSSYDAHYLALAERLQCDLWTADERFWRAAHVRFDRLKWIGNAEVLPTLDGSTL